MLYVNSNILLSTLISTALYCRVDRVGLVKPDSMLQSRDVRLLYTGPIANCNAKLLTVSNFCVVRIDYIQSLSYSEFNFYQYNF